jgi:hypothetical protein
MTDWTDTLDVFCADIGSLAGGNFAWARRIPGTGIEPHAPEDIGALANAVIALLAEDKPVAVGFETPLFVPVPEDSALLGKARPCDAGGPAWSGTPGATVLAQALAQIPWILRRIVNDLPGESVHFAWEPFSMEQSGLLLWEAFVSGPAKGESHEEDAIAAVEEFCSQLPAVGDANAHETPRPFSLIAAAAMWAGLPVAPQDLRQPCVLVRAKPA